MMRSATQPHARTKIVATLGPATDDPSKIAQLVSAGVDVFRLNMAHGDRGSHERKISAIRGLGDVGAAPAILVDLAGPKLRLGTLLAEPFVCQKDATIRFVRGDTSTVASDLVTNYPALVDELKTGEDILLADGTVRLVVTETSADAAVCRVVDPGQLRSRQGMHITRALPGLPALTPHDVQCVPWVAEQGVDYVSLSFVQSADDVLKLKSLMQECQFSAPVIAKIEKREALANLEAIVEAADGVMVARGDLGVEIDVAEVPAAQKRIVSLCNWLQKPVIVATEMLDSMQTSPRPTRAEATDVANAILDGADACMLSGETAVGSYPVESVTTMNRIMVVTEESLRDRLNRLPTDRVTTGVWPVTSAIVYAAAKIAERLNAKLVVVSTRSGATALAKSTQRDFVPTVAVSDDPSVLRRMALYWGIRPLANAPVGNLDQLREFIERWGKDADLLRVGDQIVFIAGRDTGQVAHNSVTVHTVS